MSDVVDPVVTDPVAVPAVDVVVDPVVTDPVAPVVPETTITYTDFTIPEGMAVNDELLGEFKNTLSGIKLNQEQAQMIMDLGVKHSQSLMAQVAEAQTAEQAAYLEAFNTGPDSVAAEQFTPPKLLVEQASKWQEQLAKDPEFGGAKFDENVGIAVKGINAFATPELKQFLNKTGMGSHPELVKAFYKVGQRLSEGSLVVGNSQPADNRRLADKFYGK